MRLTDEEMDEYNKNGFILLPGLFSPDEVDALRTELPAIAERNSPARVVEKDGRIVRSVYGSHKTNKVFGRLTRHPRILVPAMQILNSDLYVYQFKLNIKAAFHGDLWEWHQDYVFWHHEDGMPRPDVTNVSIFLDEVTEFNGPLFFIPNSHSQGMIDVPARKLDGPPNAARQIPYQDKPAWITSLTVDLKYGLGKETVRKLVDRYGIVAPKGPAGSALFFHCNLVHGSPNNISPHDRAVIIITYNRVGNAPRSVGEPRPEFLAERDSSPLTPLSDDVLCKLS